MATSGTDVSFYDKNAFLTALGMKHWYPACCRPLLATDRMASSVGTQPVIQPVTVRLWLRIATGYCQHVLGRARVHWCMRDLSFQWQDCTFAVLTSFAFGRDRERDLSTRMLSFVTNQVQLLSRCFFGRQVGLRSPGCLLQAKNITVYQVFCPT